MYPVAIVDIDLIKIAVATATIRNKEVNFLLEKGGKIIEDEFGEIIDELKNHSIDKVQEGKARIAQPEMEEANINISETMDKLFKDFCKENHPDKGGDNDYFVEMKEKYESGDFSGFIEGCKIDNTPQLLYEKWKHLEFNSNEVVKKKGYLIARAQTNNRKKYYKLLYEEYVRLERKIEELKNDKKTNY